MDVMPRFVIQQHDRQGQPTHWDLMLEQGEALKTFRLDLPPSDLLDHPAQASLIFDHQIRFLSYEGPVNKGLGSVRIAESGVYETTSRREASWGLRLDGAILKGEFRLTCQTDGGWEFSKVCESA